MASLKWQETGSKNASPKVHATAAPALSGSSGPPVASQSNLWFAVSMGLMGVIAGFGIASWRGAGPSAPGFAPPQVAQAPIQAPTPTPTPIQPPAPSAGPLQPVDSKTDHIRGDLSKATVAVIEYSDMECPFCKRVHPTFQQMMKEYGDKVVWVYRHFPLSFHANAHKEAEASECVAELGGNDAFWKFLDYVFDKTTSNGTGFPLDQLPVAAKQAGVDEKKFQSCLDSGKYVKLVDDEESSGASAGVQGTPGNFVVNLKTQKNQIVSGAQPFANFKTAIDAMLQ